MSNTDRLLNKGDCRLTLTNDATAAELACVLARQYGKRLGFSESELNQIELGLEEAVSNVVRHAFPKDETHSFELFLETNALGLEIKIRDQGLPFDPASIPEYNPTLPPERQPDAGLGTHILRQCFDLVEYTNLGLGGKELGLYKYRALVPLDKRQEPAPRPPESLEPLTELRLLRPQEALEVSRLIHDAYGYSYPYEHIYFPERVMALNESGELISALALTASGQIIGHAALVPDKDNPECAELGMMVTRNSHRNQGVARALGDFLLREAEQRGVQLLYTNAVSVHPYTQQFMQSLGFVDCALRPAHAPGSVEFRKIKDKLEQRESFLLSLRLADKDKKARSFWMPPLHTDLIRAIYESLDMELHPLHSLPAFHPELSTHLDVSLHSALGFVQLRVQHWGTNALTEIKARMAEFKRQRIQVMELLLPLQDAEAMSALPAVEGLGFIFCGVWPALEPEDDMLVLTWIADNGFDTEQLQMASELGQQLLAHLEERLAAL